MAKADLHLHTRFSDGLDNPRDVVQAAHQEGLQVTTGHCRGSCACVVLKRELGDRMTVLSTGMAAQP